MTTAKATIGQSTTRYGTPRPFVEIFLPPGTPWRVGTATLYHVAACIEVRTPAHEVWLVTCLASNDRKKPGGRVEIELGDGTELEAARAIAVLRLVVATLFGEAGEPS